MFFEKYKNIQKFSKSQKHLKNQKPKNIRKIKNKRDSGIPQEEMIKGELVNSNLKP
jgi:hypothetical protein